MTHENDENPRLCGIWIAAEVAHDPDLTLAEKFCFGVISALDKGKGFWMKNDTLAAIVGISPTYASVCIGKLKEKGLIKVDARPGFQRTIVCIDREALRGRPSERPTTPEACEKHKAPLAKSERPTNDTRTDGTSWGLKELPLAMDTPPTWKITEAFHKAWCEWVDYRSARKPKLSPMSARKQLDFLFGVPAELMAVEIINNSIRNGWQGLFPVSGSAGKRQDHPSRKITYTDDELS